MILLGWRDAWANRAAWFALAGVLALGLALVADAMIASSAAGVPGRRAAAATQGAEYVTVVTLCVVVVVMTHLQALVVQDRRNVYRLWALAGASRFRTCLTLTAQGMGCVLVAIPAAAGLSAATAPAVARSLGIEGAPGLVGAETWRPFGLATLLILTGTGVGSVGSVLSATRDVELLGPSRSRRRRCAVMAARVGVGLLMAPLVAVVGAAVVTTMCTGGSSPMFSGRAGATTAGGSVFPTLALTMLLALVAVTVVSLLARRVVPRLITALGPRGETRRTWLLLGWRAAAEDARTSMGSCGPILLGCGFIGVILGFVDVANAYAGSAGVSGGLDRREALVLLAPTLAVSLVGHGATLVVLGRSRARTVRVLRAAGATMGEMIAAAAVAGAVIALGALAVAVAIIAVSDGLFAMTNASAGGSLEGVLFRSVREVLLFALAAVLCSVIGAVAGVWATRRDDGTALDADE